MSQRAQQTIRRSAEVRGVGFLTGADVTLRFRPAPPWHGIAFARTDLAGSGPVPARIEYAIPRQRRTAISRRGATIEMTEHVLAALAGLRIDNCLVELDAPEPPGLDGSSHGFVEALAEAGIERQDAPRPLLTIEHPVSAAAPERRMALDARPLSRPALVIGYDLDYGATSPIPAQSLTIEITPETFAGKLAFTRTFVLEAEVAALRAQGYGRRTTTRDLLVFGNEGVIDNALRVPDECVRHKILDLIGDLALLGCDLHGHIHATRSGHELNRELARRLRAAHPNLTLERHYNAA